MINDKFMFSIFIDDYFVQGEKPYDLLQLPGPSQNQRNSHNHSHGAPPPSLHWLPYRIRKLSQNIFNLENFFLSPGLTS